MKKTEFGYFGNIWVRQNTLDKGENHEGHLHKFDHVTLLVSGKIQVKIEGYEPTFYTAPTFVIIRKEFYHTITALEENTLYYCIYALRDVEGEVITDLYGSAYDPQSAGAVKPDDEISSS